METNFKIEKYNKENSYSFSFGAFPTFELIKKQPKQAICLLIHSKLKMSEDIKKRAEKEIDEITKEFSDKVEAEFKTKSDEIMKI